MNKKQFSERDICSKYITPALEHSGWHINTHVREEYALTAGRIIVRGKLHTRAKNKRTDYVLFYKPNIPIAVIEAKDNNHSVGDGMQQALGYAEMLQVPFVFSSNGDGFLFHNAIATDGIIERELALHEFPAAETLWQWWAAHRGLNALQSNLVTQDYHSDGGKKPLPHILALTNMMLHGIDVPTNIRHDNTLARQLQSYTPKDRVDIVITNPPFGGMEEDGIESNFLKKYQTRETADLFIALIMYLLRFDTGRAAVVLPDGFLFGEGVRTTSKRELLEEFNLHTIVRLPKGVFSPYTGISTNILFFEKGGPTREVWFFQHPYPAGYKSYSRSKPPTVGEFDREKGWWGGAERTGRKTTELA